MPVCRRGHSSESEDFCDECGVPIAAPAPANPVSAGASGSGPAGEPEGEETAGPVEVCPRCGTPRGGRFCEEDGYDFVLVPAATPTSSTSGAPVGSPAAPVVLDDPSAPLSADSSTPDGPGAVATWVVRIEADRRYFESILARRGPDIDTVGFPTYYPGAEIVLDRAEMRIGRRRSGSTSAPPHIDLTGPPLDPGVSHLHAVLLARPDGGWAVLDPGSTNGTTVNYADEPVATDTAIPLDDGDRIHVGAYTTLVLGRGTGTAGSD